MARNNDLQERLNEFLLNFNPDDFDAYFDDLDEDYYIDKKKKLLIAS